MIASEEQAPTQTSPNIRFHPLLRFGATIVSYVFHPLFVPLYMGWFLISEVQLFPELDDWHKSLLLLSIFVIYTLLPLVTILLAKALGFIQSVFLKSQKDRIIPYIVCEIFYFWGWYVSRNLSYPKELVMFELGIFLSSCMGMIVNPFIKVSMHAICFGVVCAFMVIHGLGTEDNTGFYITATMLIAGLVGTARLIRFDHEPSEVYIGFILGVIAEIAGFLFT